MKMKSFNLICAAATFLAALIFTSARASTADYAKKLTMTVNSSRFAQSDGSISGLPVPVRLSTAISGFSYDDITQTGSSKDLYFVDGENNVLPYEIEKWNEQGESIVWVRVPAFAAGAHIYMYYGGPAVEQNAAAVWSGYTGVWHMAEDSGTVADATGNNLDAVPAGEDTTQSVATAGPVGNGRVNAADNKHNYLSVADSGLLDLGNSLSFSGWVRLDALITGQLMSIVMRKESVWDGGWNVNVLNNAEHPYSFGYYGGGNADWGSLAALDVPNLLGNWVHIVVTYNNNTGYMYINGEKWATVRQSDWTSNTWVSAPSDNDNPLSFGYTSNGHYEVGPHLTDAFQGAFDEFRLHDDVLDATRIKAEYVSQAYADAFVYEVSEVLTGSVTLADAVTSGIVSENGKNTLTVTANVTAINGESAKVFLAVGVSEPKDGDPALRMVGIITNEVTAAGTTTFVWDGAVLGTKIAFAVMNVVGTTTNATATTTMPLEDPVDYEWIANGEGLWSDSTKWTTSASDGLPRLGYPSYGSKINIFGNQTDVIEVDASYTGIRAGTLGWGGADITFRGTVEGAGASFNNGGFKDGQYDDIKVTLDGVRFDAVGSYHVKNNASLTMLNGAYLYTRWEFTVEGSNASLYVGDGCELFQDGVDGNRFQFSGENASIVISNGLVRAKSLRIGARNSSDTQYAGKCPAGFRFEGASPQLRINNEANIPVDVGADIPVVFCIPENGFGAAPIVKGSTANTKFAVKDSSDNHGLAFAIDVKSPYLAVKSKFRQPLVDWTYNNTAYEVNADAISLAEMKYAPTARMYFTPEEGGATKSGVEAYCYTQKGTQVIIR